MPLCMVSVVKLRAIPLSTMGDRWLILLGVSAWNRSWLRPRRRVKQHEIETHAPIRAVTRGVCVVLAADLKADRLLPNLQNLADLKNERNGPFRVGVLFQFAVDSVLRVKVVCVLSV
jgi:hypothetical protein